MKTIKNIAKLSALFILVQFFTACSGALTNYNKDTKVMSFQVNGKVTKDIQFTNPKYTPLHSKCIAEGYIVQQSYLKEYGRLVIVKKILDTQRCHWNGATDGFFLTSVKNYYKANTIRLVNKTEIGQYIFREYLVDDKKTTKTIQAWQTGGDTFVIDKNGFFADELLEELKKYNNKQNSSE